MNVTIETASGQTTQEVGPTLTITSFVITSEGAENDGVIAQLGMGALGQVQWQTPAGVPIGAITVTS